MKIHLANSDERLPLGSDIRALCGKVIPKAEAALMWDDGCSPDFLDFLNSFQLCKNCKETGLSFSGLRKRYVYGLLPGSQSLIDEQTNPNGKEEISQETMQEKT